jgi:hypothetical protein
MDKEIKYRSEIRDIKEEQRKVNFAASEYMDRIIKLETMVLEENSFCKCE